MSMKIERRLEGREISEVFAGMSLNEEERSYLAVHANRIAYFANRVSDYADRIILHKGRVKVLDVGPHFLSYIIRMQHGEETVLNTLGWENSRLMPRHLVTKHYEYDLNMVQHPNEWIIPEEHDIIMMLEVIEHLYTAPELVLLFLKTVMNSDGYLTIGTPNAVSLQKRIGMVRGKNPYELIRINNTNPGHFREYTGNELVRMCRNTGFTVVELEYHNFNDTKGKLRRLKHSLSRIVPQFRDFLSIVCQNRPEE